MSRRTARLRSTIGRDGPASSAGPPDDSATRPARPGSPSVRPARADDPEVEVAVVLDLLDAACGAGVSIPRALDAVGHAVGGRRGTALARAAAGLGLGAGWAEAWAAAPADLAPVRDALRGAWEQGASALGTLDASATALRARRRALAAEAAGRLGVRLVLPLGLCFLPAFVLVGLVPVLLAMAGAGFGS